MSKCIINNNIRKLRFLTNEMTQQELAYKTGVTRQTIIAIENGKYYPSLELAFQIANVFNSPLEEVFLYTPEENSGGTANKNLVDKICNTDKEI
jgi:putative transcriptional regulator